MATHSANPFAGVNPFIEWNGYWRDFHRTFINYFREFLLRGLPSGYDARIEEDTLLVNPDLGIGRRIPDVAVVGPERPDRSGGGAAVAIIEPSAELEVEPVDVELQKHVWIEIRTLEPDRLVTSIEILSPTNKQGRGLAEFLLKREELLDIGANLVDIDLLIDGTRMPFRKPLPPGDLFAFVTRQSKRPLTQVYGWNMDQPLRQVPIPLLAPDPDVVLDLQSAYTLAFERGGYPRRLRYASAPESAPAGWRAYSERALASIAS